jgi:hypothetical protein
MGHDLQLAAAAGRVVQPGGRQVLRRELNELRVVGGEFLQRLQLGLLAFVDEAMDQLA